MSTISAGTTSGTALVSTGDTTGALVLQTNGSTTAVTIDASQNVTFANSANLPNTFGFKNRIINGAMVIDQRNSGAEVNPAVSFDYYLDRWFIKSQQSGKFKIGQNAGAVTPPTGFIKYLGITSLAATTVGASDAYQVRQNIEGFNVADLGWGTASAETVTLSFRVYSSLTGTFGGALRNSADNRSYPFSYSIPTANTWTTISITIAGDTSGTWLTDNGIGIQLLFSLGVGSTLSGTAGAWAAANYQSATGAVSVVGTNGATWYITGVQLEKGSTATSFDVRDYGRELIMCQRYYQQNTVPTAGLYGNTMGQVYAGTNIQSGLQLSTPMRATPSASIIGTLTWSGGLAGNTTVNLSSFGTIYYTPLTTLIGIAGTVASSQTGGYNWTLSSSAGGGYSLSAEL
jgi:hypothetical protein